MSIPYAVFSTKSATDSEAPPTVGVVNPSGTVYSKMWSGLKSDGYSLDVSTTGTLAGTLTLWNANKPQPSETDDTDWNQDTGFAPTAFAGAPVKYEDNTANDKAFRKRLKYVHTSGAGTLTAYVVAPRLS